jgi:hypothetical protein
VSTEEFLKQHGGELTILILSAMILVTLLLVVPHLLRSHLRSLEMMHEERLRSLEQGLPLPQMDERSLFAGRTALLVPIVSMCAACTVTCFLAANKVESVFSISLGVMSVAAVVSLAAITGCVSLLMRLAQLQKGVEEEEFEDRPLKK